MTDTINNALNRWTNAEEIRLRAGEIEPKEMRTILAVTRAMAREIRAIMEEDAVGKVEFWLDDLPSDPPSDMRMARELAEKRRINSKAKKDE